MIEVFVGALISVLSIIAFIELRINKELKPNGGTSIKDKVNILETKVDLILDHLIDKKI